MTDSNQTATKGGSQNPILARLSALGNNQSTVLVGVMILLIVVFSILEPKFLSVATANNILTDWGSVVLIAVGQTFVVISGGIDLSVGAIMVLSSVVMGQFMGAHEAATGKTPSGMAVPATRAAWRARPRHRP